jgi:UDP-N-acetylglucosamine 1-carboxyvinyltransferase
MVTYHITGGTTLSGSIDVQAGKNSPIALLAASLLIAGPVTFKGFSNAEEIQRILEILSSIGVTYSWNGDTLTLDTSGPLTMHTIDKKACERVRASLLLMGALAARTKSFKLYRSGGCNLGNRTVRPHLLALQYLGVKIETKPKYYQVTTKKLTGNHIVMYESGDTATENVIMAAVLAPGKTTIKMASANYMVQDVCYFLQASGAKIKGIGTTTLEIEGVSELRAPKEYVPMPDPVDAMAWISLAVTTASPLTITNCPIEFLELELEKLKVMGQRFTFSNQRKSENKKFDVVDITLIPSQLTALPDKLYGRPFPGINIDAIPLFMPILTQAKGRTLVHDWVYENRALYALELQKLGANVSLLDPHRVYIEGKTRLLANEVMCPPALRPGMAIFIAMLAAKGTSTLRNAYMIERAYGDLAERLVPLGAHITRTIDS